MDDALNVSPTTHLRQHVEILNILAQDFIGVQHQVIPQEFAATVLTAEIDTISDALAGWSLCYVNQLYETYSIFQFR